MRLFILIVSCMPSPRIVLAFTTCGDRVAAERLARLLVEAHVAACVSVGSPTLSVYPWQGRIESESEVPVTIKTSPARVGQLKNLLVEHHEYDVPELLVTEVVDGLDAYMDWAEDWMSHD